MEKTPHLHNNGARTDYPYCLHMIGKKLGYMGMEEQ